MPTKKKEPSPPPSPGSPDRIQVEIFGSTYSLRGGADADTVRSIAADLDDRMTLLARSSPDADPVKVAILTALRMGDEIHHSRQDLKEQQDAAAERISSCAGRLARLLDPGKSAAPNDVP